MSNRRSETTRRYRNRMREHRKSQGLSVKAMAIDLGIDPSYLCSIEGQRKLLSMENALRATEILGCKLDDLFERAA
jgi:transcriptional regulator with XRE-family HTH domain